MRLIERYFGTRTESYKRGYRCEYIYEASNGFVRYCITSPFEGVSEDWELIVEPAVGNYEEKWVIAESFAEEIDLINYIDNNQLFIYKVCLALLTDKYCSLREDIRKVLYQ